jgi:hypothetical protein
MIHFTNSRDKVAHTLLRLITAAWLADFDFGTTFLIEYVAPPAPISVPRLVSPFSEALVTARSGSRHRFDKDSMQDRRPSRFRVDATRHFTSVYRVQITSSPQVLRVALYSAGIEAPPL